MPALWKRRCDGLDALVGPQHIPLSIQRLLVARGLSDATLWEQIFSPKLSELKSPWLLKDMEIAIERLLLAHERGERVCLYADFDLDGTSGLALALQGFRDLGYQQVLPVQPLRLADGYGFHASIVEELAKKDIKVIVTIDVGITAHVACEKAKELGIDVIITDHHQPTEEKAEDGSLRQVLPPAYAVINPNRRDCESSLGYLCGAGVAFYVLRALKRRLLEAGRVTEESLNLRSLLDFLTIATLTDMVPLTHDNRLLVKHGLQVLSETRRPGLRALLDELRLGGKALTGPDVAIRFAPKLNALSRLELGLRPLDLFLTETIEDAENLVAEVLAQNSERVELQGRGEEIALEMAKEWPHEEFIYVRSKEFHRGVVGLIATKLAGLLGRPAFVGSEGGEGVVVGSARSPQGTPISVLKALNSAEAQLTRFGGHPPAAGFELHVGRENEFVQKLAEHFKNHQAEAEIEVEYDFEMPLSGVSSGLIRWLEALGPFGTQFPAPLFCFRDLTVESIKVMKGNHLRLEVLGAGTTKPVSALFFSPPPHLKIRPGERVDLLGEVQKNDFRRVIEPQILIRDLLVLRRPSSEIDQPIGTGLV